MHGDDGSPRTVLPSHSKGAQRRRRLTRGIARWNHDRKLCAEPTRVVATLTLTVPEADAAAAVGRVYRFWAQVRRRWLGTRYFCWLELQRRGAVHYHCVWLNPPHLKRQELKAWVAHAWGGGRTQVRFSAARDGLQREIDYAVAYSKKMGSKSYQQRYDEVPRQLRTFMSQRLDIPPEHIDPCLDTDLWEHHPEWWSQSGHVPEHLVLVGRREHVLPPGARCVALDWRRIRPGNSRASPFKAVRGSKSS